MDPKNLRTLKLLEEIEKDQVPTQRDLAEALSVSLGLVNSFIKRLAQRGYLKIISIPKSRAKYVLTPKGVAEKTRLTYESIQYSFEFYRAAKQKLQRLFGTLEDEGVGRVALYGAGDIAEIAYIFLQETRIEMVAVLDRGRSGQPFFSTTVSDPSCIDPRSYHRLIVTADTSSVDAMEQIRREGIPRDKVVVLE